MHIYIHTHIYTCIHIHTHTHRNIIHRYIYTDLHILYIHSTYIHSFQDFTQHTSMNLLRATQYILVHATTHSQMHTYKAVTT